jgi:hypothetical protein
MEQSVRHSIKTQLDICTSVFAQKDNSAKQLSTEFQRPFMDFIFGKTLCSSPITFQSEFDTPITICNKIRSSGSSRSSSGWNRPRKSDMDSDTPSRRQSIAGFGQDGANLDISRIVAVTSINSKLSAARVEWPEGSNNFFVPMNDMARILTSKAIAEELRQHTIPSGFPIDAELTAKYIKHKATKLFAILVHLKKGRLIWDFLKEKIDDSHLPFTRSDRKGKSNTYKLYSKIDPQKRIICTRHWDQESIIAFAREQWTVNAPVFHPATTIHDYEFHDNTILPFIRDEGRSNNVASGGFSTVWEVVIHPAHQKLYKTSYVKVR